MIFLSFLNSFLSAFPPLGSACLFYHQPRLLTPLSFPLRGVKGSSLLALLCPLNTPFPFSSLPILILHLQYYMRCLWSQLPLCSGALFSAVLTPEFIAVRWACWAMLCIKDVSWKETCGWTANSKTGSNLDAFLGLSFCLGNNWGLVGMHVSKCQWEMCCAVVRCGLWRWAAGFESLSWHLGDSWWVTEQLPSSVFLSIKWGR